MTKKILDLTAKHEILLSYFANKRKTVTEACEELNIPYKTAIRYVKELIDAGYIAEIGFRENNRRYLSTIRSPDKSPEYNLQAHIIVDAKLQSISEYITNNMANPEVPIRNDLLVALGALSLRSLARKAGDDNPGGMSPIDIMTTLRRIQVRIDSYSRFIDALLKAPVWVDDELNHERIGLPDLTGAETQVAEFERRYVGENKAPLEK